MDDNWTAYYTRAAYKKAKHMHYLAEAMNEDYEPLTKETWIKRELNRTHPSKRKLNHPHYRVRNKLLYAKTTLIYVHETTNSEGEATHRNNCKFDTDSGKVGIDNRAIACISHVATDFEGPLVPVKRLIKGFGGERVWNVFKGTIVWKWHDNEGQLHRFSIPNSYYVPHGKCRLLSPQHWAQTQLRGRVTPMKKLSQNTKDGIGESTLYNRCQVFWDRRQYMMDVYLGEHDNVATFYLAPGFKSFDLFCKECKIDTNDDTPIYAMPAGVVSDDEDGVADDDDVPPPNEKNDTETSFLHNLLHPARKLNPLKAKQTTPEPRHTAFDLVGKTTNGERPPVVIDEEEEKQATTPAQELLRYHHRMAHSNGLAERRIRSLQVLARSMLIHMNNRWRMPGIAHLWLYAIRMANDAINEAPNLRDEKGRSPLQLFSQTDIQTHNKHWIPFGCPVYVLDPKLRTGQGFLNTWEARSRVGIYLGRSPNHGRNVALVLNRLTGWVSPQFHVTFDKGFNTVKQDKYDTHWQMRAKERSHASLK